MANYNNGSYVREAIRSVIAQTLSDWELIVVDDASTDNSVEVINAFSSDKRIKLIKLRRNEGYGKALRTAIGKASRPILGILDSDDALRTDALSIMVKAHATSDAGLIYSQFTVCDNHLCEVEKGFCRPLPKGVKYLDVMGLVSHFKTFKRSAYDRTDGFTARRRTVDKDLVLKLEEVSTLKFVRKDLYLYRVHPRGISWDKTTPPFVKAIKREAMVRRGMKIGV